MTLFERVLIAVGEGSVGLDVIRYACSVRGILGEVEFCFVLVLGWPTRVQLRTEPTTHAQALRRLEDDVARHFGGGRVRCIVLDGSIIDRLLESAAEFAADLILVGHNGDHSGRRPLARRLAMQSPASVWMKPLRSGPSLQHVVAAIDYSEGSAHALSVAGHIASRAGAAGYRALHVYLNNGSGAEAHEREAFDCFTTGLDTAGIEVRPVLVKSPSVAEAIQQFPGTEPADLIVVGSRGQSRSRSVLLGGESEQVLMESQPPVLIAKRRGEPTGVGHAMPQRNFHLQDPPRFGKSHLR